MAGQQPTARWRRAFAVGSGIGLELVIGYYVAHALGAGPFVSALVGLVTLGVAWETVRRWERSRAPRLR
jgi:hypothetical protein